MRRIGKHVSGFTLLELLIVIAIIAILAGLLFPAFMGAQKAAKKTQAKNDLTQIVTAVNGFYTEYGKYPLVTDDTPLSSTTDLFYTLRAVGDKGGANANNAINTRQIVFLSPPDVKDTANPRSGIGTDGQWYDAWGTTYKITINGTYDNGVPNPYGPDPPGGAGPDPIRQGVIAWSFGPNGLLGGGNATDPNFSNENGTVNIYTGSSDAISWQ
jgi:prepilin-type N-terminal cleavage/methylation domain-containing protein